METKKYCEWCQQEACIQLLANKIGDRIVVSRYCCPAHLSKTEKLMSLEFNRWQKIEIVAHQKIDEYCEPSD